MKDVSQFDAVQPGRSWWWWWRSGEQNAIHKVVRDGSGGLWVETHRGGVRLHEFAGVPLGPVSAVPDVDQNWVQDGYDRREELE